MTITGHATKHYTEYYVVTECIALIRDLQGTDEDGALIVMCSLSCPRSGTFGAFARHTVAQLTLSREVLTRAGSKVVPFVPLFDRLLDHFLPQCAVNHLNGDVAHRYCGERVRQVVASAFRGAARKCVGISWHWLGWFWVSEIAAVTMNAEPPAALPTRSSESPPDSRLSS